MRESISLIQYVEKTNKTIKSQIGGMYKQEIRFSFDIFKKEQPNTKDVSHAYEVMKIALTKS